MEGQLLYHVFVFGFYVVALIYDAAYLAEIPGRKSYAGRFKYLTFWNEMIQTAYFGFAIVTDIIGSNWQSKHQHLKQQPDRGIKWQRWKDFIAATIVFPVGTFVVVTFWSLYAYDRELIFPAVLDKVVPAWMNHVWHTFVIVFVIVEKIFVYQEYPSRRSGLSVLFLFGLIYLLWMCWIAYFGNFWIYPVFAVFNWLEKIIFIAVCCIILLLSYLTGEVITTLLWRHSSRSVHKVD